MNFGIILALCITLFIFAIPAESTYLAVSACANNSAVAQWTTYITGSCFPVEGYGARKSSCVDGGRAYKNEMCEDDKCSKCMPVDVTPMNQCVEGQYSTCTTGEPDYSHLGPKYALAKVYMSDKCDDAMVGAVAGKLNTCLVNPAPPNTYQFNSVLITCKSGVAKVTTYLDFNCNTPTNTMSARVGKCTPNSGLGYPIIASCINQQ